MPAKAPGRVALATRTDDRSRLVADVRRRAQALLSRDSAAGGSAHV